MGVAKIRRDEEILRILYEKGHVEVRDISAQLDVSEATARRDLRRMSEEGLLELVYGGATLPRHGNYSLRTRQARNMEAKQAIGRLAASLVRPADCLFIDSGTTCGCMTPHLRASKGLQVITNSNLVAADLGEHTDFEIMQLGGRFRFDRMDSIGPFAQSVIAELSGYRAFMGADGLSLDFGLTSTDIDTAHLYRAVIEHSAETVLLVDHTKFANPTLHRIIGIDAVNCIVTDCAPPEGWTEELDRRGVDVLFPGGAEIAEAAEAN